MAAILSRPQYATGCCVYCNWNDYGFDPNRFQELHRARPNVRHFAKKKNDDMFKFIFVYDSNFMEICSSALLKISRKAISWTNDVYISGRCMRLSAWKN